MLRSIIRKEILSNLFSYKFSIITILSTVLILVSIFVMYRDYCLALENYETLQLKSNEAIAIIPPTPLIANFSRLVAAENKNANPWFIENPIFLRSLLAERQAQNQHARIGPTQTAQRRVEGAWLGSLKVAGLVDPNGKPKFRDYLTSPEGWASYTAAMELGGIVS